MNPSTVKNTLRFLPYWSLEGGLASFDIEYAKCTVTVTGNLLSFQQAREFFPILQKAIAESSFDEPIAVRGFVREIRKLASYRISITEGSDTLDFPLIERICLYGSNPKATIRLEPVFFSLLTEAGMFFDESIVDSVKSRISWVFSRLAKLYGNSETSVDLELLEKLVSADQFDAKRWLTENNVAVQGKKVCLNILSAWEELDEEAEPTPEEAPKAPASESISLDEIPFEDVRDSYIEALSLPSNETKKALMEIVSLLKNDKKAGKKLENVLRRWGYDRIKKTESSPSGVNDPLVPPITLQAIDREAFASNPLLTPFVEFVNARLVRNGVAVCSGPQDVKKFSQLKSLVTKYGATVVVEAAKKYIFKNPGKGAEGYAIKNIEREAMIIASKTTY